MNQLGPSARLYLRLLGRAWYGVALGGVFAVVGAAQGLVAAGSIPGVSSSVVIPAWIWNLGAILSFIIASFVPFHRIRSERDEMAGSLRELESKRSRETTRLHNVPEVFNYRLASLRAAGVREYKPGEGPDGAGEAGPEGKSAK
jgi:hypothetical protein